MPFCPFQMAGILSGSGIMNLPTFLEEVVKRQAAYDKMKKVAGCKKDCALYSQRGKGCALGKFPEIFYLAMQTISAGLGKK